MALTVLCISFLLFSIEHIVALVHGTEVEPAWH